MTRILTAVAGIPLVLVLLFWPGGTPWAVFVAALVAMACWEYASALWKKGIFTHWVAMVAGCAVLFPLVGGAAMSEPQQAAPPGSLPSWLPRGIPSWDTLIFLAMLLLAADLAWSRRAPIRNIGSALLGVCWFGLLLPVLVTLRTMDSICECCSAPAGDYGAWLVLWALLIIWMGDSAAYFAGRQWGGRKLAPAISPNKTWSGAFGGLAGSALGGVIGAVPLLGDTGVYRLTGLVIVAGLFTGVLAGIAGQVGDLVESSVKREIGLKDFGSLLPGHGGVLDRFDSLMFAAPMVWLCARLFLY